ncbi:MAG: cation-translocating P-type ATPase [Myxococcales bacterium]|nr:cation-translocating P-type ATPase [Myxococcales bacterium]
MSTEPEVHSPAIPGQKEGPPRLAWHHAAPAEIADYWQADVQQGLTEAQATERLARVGPNRLPEAPAPPLWKRLVNQVANFTVGALVGAALIAGVIAIVAPEPGMTFFERFGDSLAILSIVVLNAFLGLLQEAKAEKALEALRGMTAPTARVMRGGKTLDVPAAEIVPGDLILFEEGDRVAADVRLTVTRDLEVEEAALTGEALPVQKNADAKLEADTPLADRETMVFMGTKIARGRARGLVANTGLHTELGAIAGMLARVEAQKTPLEQDLDRFGQRVVMGCIAISGLVFASGYFLGHQSTRELFLVAVALAVAAIPEGLPAVTTIVLALGTQRMARRNALVRRLPAVETLGCTQVICTDKTGTLTQNAMTVRQAYVSGVRYDVDGEGRSPEGKITERAAGSEAVPDLLLALRAAIHSVGARLTLGEDGRLEVQGDPTDAAILVFGWKGGQREHANILGEQPFTSERRMASVVVEEASGPRAYVRGAPEALIARCTRLRKNGDVIPLSDEERDAALGEAAKWAGRAMRVIALAYKDGADEPERDLVFLALVGIVDPPRPEVKGAIAEARAAGIRTMMITGDHPATARAISEEIGLWEENALLLTGSELDQLDQQRLEQQIDRVRVVARATAQNKLRIVDALKARGFVCAMTGDGVNDAPAVKSASIGVAMGRTGTDVTKEAADLVLADDNYATILAAVAEGRSIYANIQKFVFFLLSSNTGCVLVVLLASLLGWEAPLMPIQILWINLITNGLPALALGVEAREPNQMSQPPRAPGGAIMSGRDYFDMLAVGAVMAATALWAFHHQLPDGLASARSTCFAILAIGPLFHSFNCRSQTSSIFKLGLFSNRALWGAMLIGIALEIATIQIPAMHPIFKTAALDLEAGLIVLAMSIVPLVLGELVKLINPERRKPASVPAAPDRTGAAPG